MIFCQIMDFTCDIIKLTSENQHPCKPPDLFKNDKFIRFKFLNFHVTTISRETHVKWSQIWILCPWKSKQCIEWTKNVEIITDRMSFQMLDHWSFWSIRFVLPVVDRCGTRACAPSDPYRRHNAQHLPAPRVAQLRHKLRPWLNIGPDPDYNTEVPAVLGAKKALKNWAISIFCDLDFFWVPSLIFIFNLWRQILHKI